MHIIIFNTKFDLIEIFITRNIGFNRKSKPSPKNKAYFAPKILIFFMVIIFHRLGAIQHKIK